MATYFYDLPTTLKRRNMFIYPAESGPGRLQVYNLPAVSKEVGVKWDELDYVYPGWLINKGNRICLIVLTI